MAAVALNHPTPSWTTGFAVVGRIELSRARAARVPLLFVAAFQSLGILVLLRGVVSGHRTSTDVTRPSVVAGCTVLVAAFTALNLLAQRLGALRGSGALDRYGVLPVAPSAVVLGTAGAFAAFTLPGALVTAGVGCALYDLPARNLWILVLVLPLAGAALAGVGALIGLLAPKQELATVLGQLGMSLVLFVGIIPKDRLPEVVRILRAVVPASYAVDALADTFRSHVPWGSVAADLGVCVVVAVVLLSLSGWAFRRSVAGR
jgi:ABC-2 type transport system permease protein